MKKRVFVDLDGPLVDFDRYMREHNATADEVKVKRKAYLEMHPVGGAIDAVRSIIGMGYDVWIATKPPTGVPHAYADKAEWVMRNLNELTRKIIITHHKGMLGGADDFLIDDRPHKAGCEEFAGTLIKYGEGFGWPEILDMLREHAPNHNRRQQQ